MAKCTTRIANNHRGNKKKTKHERTLGTKYYSSLHDVQLKAK